MWIRRLTTNNLHILAMAGLLALIVATHAEAAGPSVKNGWMRVLPAGLPAGGYFELHNDGAQALTLVGAQSPGCGMVMLHKSETSGGMSRMSDVKSVTAAPGQTIKFAPGGYHLMCMQPKASMKPGGHIPVTLRFADGTTVTSEFALHGPRYQP